MEDYNVKNDGYEIFGANMTVDLGMDMTIVDGAACKSCQCNCQQCFACRNMRVGLEEGDNPSEIEKALKNLLDEAA